MAKRAFVENPTDHYSIHGLTKMWTDEHIKIWSMRSLELDKEIKDLEKEYNDWAKKYREENQDREDWESDDLWNMRWMEHQHDLYLLEDEMSYIRICLDEHIWPVML